MARIHERVSPLARNQKSEVQRAIAAAGRRKAAGAQEMDIYVPTSENGPLRKIRITAQDLGEVK